MRREPTFEPIDEGKDEDRDEDSEDRPVRPLDHPRPFARLRLAGRFVCAAALIAGLVLVARERGASGPEARAWSEPPRAAAVRQAVPGAGPLLKLDAGEGETAGRAEPPRWNAATGRREDALAGGSFDAIEAPFLRVTVSEALPGAEPPASLFVTLARRAAELQGLAVLRTGLRGQVETKFGTFETVEATLSGQGTRLCTGFQSLGERPLRIDGWLCGVLGQAPEPRAVTCALDRLVLAGRGVPTLDVVFAEAEARRDPGCGAAEVATTRNRADATGSIMAAAREAKGRTRKNAAKPRQTAQARP